ncbi:hypothetical protein ACKXGF_04750 [Alkalibacillus sp. S2W]|uniref:hypothetical protein n=1 Tax=Alkalibacillus sp. S2W TaxID=3386553 RepID=UPI00398CE5EC
MMKFVVSSLLTFVLLIGIILGFSQVNADEEKQARDYQTIEQLTIYKNKPVEDFVPTQHKASKDMITHPEHDSVDEFMENLKRGVNGKEDYATSGRDLKGHIGDSAYNYAEYFLDQTNEHDDLLKGLLEKAQPFHGTGVHSLTDEELNQKFNDLKEYVNSYD